MKPLENITPLELAELASEIIHTYSYTYDNESYYTKLSGYGKATLELAGTIWELVGRHTLQGNYSQMEIAKLACRYPVTDIFDDMILDIHVTRIEKAAELMVRKAILLLNEAELAIKREYLIEPDRPKYADALKVGTHFMPPIESKHLLSDFVSEEPIDFQKALKLVIGLSKKEQRMTWFMSHIEAYQAKDGITMNSFYPYVYYSCRFPDNKDNKPQYLNETINRAIKEGIYLREFLIEFREWRLGMRNHNTKLQTPLSMEEALLAGKEHFKKNI